MNKVVKKGMETGSITESASTFYSNERSTVVFPLGIGDSFHRPSEDASRSFSSGEYKERRLSLRFFVTTLVAH